MSDDRQVMELTVNEAIRRFPDAVAVFSRFGIDACCGGAHVVRDAANRHGIDLVLLEAELMGVIRAAR